MTKTTTVKKETAKKATASAKDKKANGKVKSEESEEKFDDEDEEEVYRWWEANEQEGTVRWTTLEHHGVLFPPEYEPLPKSVNLYYDGKAVVLPKAAEEVAGFFGAMINTDHAKKDVFQKNFFTDFLKVLKETGKPAIDKKTKEPIEIKEFAKCDFNNMFSYFEKQREIKKALPAAEKKRIKAERDEAEAKYKVCLLDGRKETVGNFRIEPPGLFRGRGDHPKTGKLKTRVTPEMVTLNIGKGSPVPTPPSGHKWKEVRHDNTVVWLAMWRENISGSTKYVMLAQNSSIRGLSDFKKFEKARELQHHIEKIRKDYQTELKDTLMLNRQRATATYLIDKLALRAGGEKGEDEADTVGCCSLRYEHVTLKPPNIVVFDFLGKDSVPYHNEQEVDPQVFKNLRIFKKAPKGPGDQIFDRLDPSILNKHLQNYMPGLTAKCFRTYNASHTMQQQMDLIPNEGTVNEKLVKYNAANRAVAILCNHQKAIGKTHEATVGKIDDRIAEMRWKKLRLKKMILVLEPKLKNKKKDFFSDINELTADEQYDIIAKVIARDKEKLQKKFDRDLAKQKEDKVPVAERVTKKELNEKIKELTVLEKQYRKEVRTKPEVKPSMTVEKLMAQVEKLELQIKNTILQKQDKEDNSTVALGTSKLNYIDPRLTVMFSKKFDVPIDKLFSKILREKFKWAIESADENWRF
jgi:DNA topoisomerase-1